MDSFDNCHLLNENPAKSNILSSKDGNVCEVGLA